MCGRYFFQMDRDNAYFFYDQVMHHDFPAFAQGEIFPTQNALILRARNDTIIADVMRWGLETTWGKRIINARMEGIGMKATFRPLLNHRCAIVANGFYEWQSVHAHKQKFYIHKQAQPLMYLAALYDQSRSFVIVTGAAKHTMAQVHPRTPIVMDETEMREYLGFQRDVIVANDALILERQ